MAEGFAALLTPEGLLAGVDSLVCVQRRALTEGPPTLLAPEWFLTGMNSHVLSQVNGLLEHFFTYVTWVPSGSHAAYWMIN